MCVCVRVCECVCVARADSKHTECSSNGSVLIPGISVLTG